MPSATISCGGRPVSSRPRKRTLPASGVTKPDTRSNSVVLPAPFGPIRPVMLPSTTVNETWSTASRPPNALDSPATAKYGSRRHRASSGLMRSGRRPFGRKRRKRIMSVP